jgi:hypothetical protein
MPSATGITIVGTPNDPARTMPGARDVDAQRPVA